ncbi:hypothetical protein HYW44_05320 [Candidatus Daviesbacteria bacterium]|nr:hypothetical protein [Candidatus Daviesbacteria bacterium]
MNKLVKIVTFVPLKDADKVRKALGEAGVGRIGKYSHCSFSTRGIGRYNPLDGASPAIGEVGKPQEVEEERIEVVCERGIAKKVIEKMIMAHPYEQPAIEAYEILDI